MYNHTVDCNGGAACLDKFFASFDANTFGLSQLLAGADLAPNIPGLCVVAVGGKFLPYAPTDLRGQTRPKTRTSMGAFQVGEGICP